MDGVKRPSESILQACAEVKEEKGATMASPLPHCYLISGFRVKTPPSPCPVLPRCQCSRPSPALGHLKFLDLSATLGPDPGTVLVHSVPQTFNSLQVQTQTQILSIQALAPASNIEYRVLIDCIIIIYIGSTRTRVCDCDCCKTV